MTRLAFARVPVRPPAGAIITVLICLAVFAARSSSALEQLDAAQLDALAGASESVVVARARQVNAAWATNEHGDRVIVSTAVLEVSETLKGRPLATRVMEFEGGTTEDVTLEVSDEPTVRTGDRAVFFLKGKRADREQPSVGEDAVLVLDDADVVRGRGLHLDDIRSRMARAGR